MRNYYSHLHFSAVSLASGAVAVLAVLYIGLIAVVMSYATLTVEFSQSIKNTEASVAALESEYLASITRITGMDYSALGYELPHQKVFVQVKSATALR